MDLAEAQANAERQAGIVLPDPSQSFEAVTTPRPVLTIGKRYLFECRWLDSQLTYVAHTPAAPAASPPPPRRPSKCLEECRRRAMTTDCADAEGGLMPCPCHCPRANED